MTASPKNSSLNGLHFAQLVAKELNFDLTYFAREGMSNGGIAIQITSAIKRKPDFIMLGISHFDRIEFPVNNIEDIHEFDVENILYKHSNSISTYYDWNRNPLLVSSNISEFLTENKDIFKNFGSVTLNNISDSAEKLETLKKFVLYLYYPQWKKQIDKWVIYSVLHQLEESKIPYIICYDLLDFIHEISWISDQKKQMVKEIYNLVKIDNDWGGSAKEGQTLAHTSLNCQKLIAEVILKNISKRFNQKSPML